MTKIILNADDFGRSKERNRAIDDCFKQGLICSAGLIVTNDHLQNAEDYINNCDYVQNIHLHVNLSSTYKRDKETVDIPLTEAMRKDPYFCKDGDFLQYIGSPYRIFRINKIGKWKYEKLPMQKQMQLLKELDHVEFRAWEDIV